MAGIASMQSWRLNDCFDHVYVINLPGKTERMNRVAEDLRAIGCEHFERWEATYGAQLAQDVWGRVDDNSFQLEPGEKLDRQHQGQAGCFMSHYKVLQDAQAHGYNTVLVLEDDNGFGFVERSSSGITVNLEGSDTEFHQVMRELPKDWDMLYFCSVECGLDGLGWMQVQSPSYSDHLNRLQYGLLTNALAIHSRAFPTILSALSKIDNPSEKFRPVDHEYALLHRDLQAFAPKRPLAYQASGQSTITGSSQGFPWDGTWTREVVSEI